VCDALQRIAKIDVEVEPCIASPDPLAYRNKIQLPVDANSRLGLYARNTHDLIPIDQCAIHSPLGEKALQQIQQALLRYPTSVKHVLIKTAVHTQQLLIILVTAAPVDLTSLAQAIFHSLPEIKGVVQNINPSSTNTILGPEFRELIGQGWIEERLCNLTFKISPASFFQVNPKQAEALYQTALDLAQLTKETRVLDAYCGVGTLSLLAAERSQEVIGIESVPDAIANARENAALNRIENATFICGKAEDEIACLGAIDVALLNPPRKGCDKAFLEALSSKRPNRIVYISCDPATLARDLQFLSATGYAIQTVQPFDMFPQTMHVECVVSLMSE
jgi:23S rRNA (uracil1939-C5)-methyltransferase